MIRGLGKRSAGLMAGLAMLMLAATAPGARAEIRSIEDFGRYTEESAFSLDYSVWTYFLQNHMLYIGRGERRRAIGGTRSTGSRVSRGHRSPYRFEGNRITFSMMSSDAREGLTDYVRDLERVSNDIDLTRLSRDEQLAFWFNLHNAALIDKLAERYPLTAIERRYEDIYETKFLTVAGIPLSLNDIRLRIVYQNWRDRPDVMYGFFHGVIGGPSIQPSAFNGKNISYLLGRTAVEFVNSLRGVESPSRGRLRISRIYGEARPYFFPDWPEDIVAHLRRFAQETVSPYLANPRRVEAEVYDWSIADVVNGDVGPPASPGQTIGRDGIARGNGVGGLPPHGQRFVRRVQERRRAFLKNRGTQVIIIDMEPNKSAGEKDDAAEKSDRTEDGTQ